MQSGSSSPASWSAPASSTWLSPSPTVEAITWQQCGNAVKLELGGHFFAPLMGIALLLGALAGMVASIGALLTRRATMPKG